jgi:hypothetical protein
MGWLFPFCFGLLAIFAFWRSEPGSWAALEIVVAAVLIAVAGYGWQGSPDMPGHPVAVLQRPIAN